MLKIKRYGDIARIESARTIAGRGYYWSTAYYVGGLLVDTGCAHSARELVRVMRYEDLQVIVNTHTHEDHIGGNGVLQTDFPNAPILVHPEGVPVLGNPAANQPLQFYRRVFWGMPEASPGSAVKDGEMVNVGNFSFQVMYSPGHSPDHICLFEPDHGWLFSGDLFVGGKDRALRSGCDIWQIIASLKRIAALPLKILFPGSARIREHPLQAISEKISYLEETGAQVLELHEQGISSGEIASRLFRNPMMIELFTMGDFSRLNLVKSYLALPA